MKKQTSKLKRNKMVVTTKKEFNLSSHPQFAEIRESEFKKKTIEELKEMAGGDSGSAYGFFHLMIHINDMDGSKNKEIIKLRKQMMKAGRYDYVVFDH